MEGIRPMALRSVPHRVVNDFGHFSRLRREPRQDLWLRANYLRMARSVSQIAPMPSS